MTVYVLLIEDRHQDVEAWVYSTADKAISAAREWVNSRDCQMSDSERDEFNQYDREAVDNNEWLLYRRTYSTQGDQVTVESHDVDPESEE